MEYLVTMTTRVPDGTPEEAVEDIRGRAAVRSRELAGLWGLARGERWACGEPATLARCGPS